MLIGLVWLLATTLLLCFSYNIAMLVIARIFQGMSAAMAWTVGLALLVDSVPKNRIGQATGWTSTALTLGILLGPLIGGIVYDKAGNYAVFGICYGLVVIDIIFRLAIIEVKDAKKWLSKDVSSSQMADQSIAASQLSASPAQEDPATAIASSSNLPNKDPGALEQGAKNKSGRAADDAFALTGRNGILGLLKKPRLVCAVFGTLMQAATQTAFDAILPLEVRDVFHWNSIGGGLIFLPLIVPTFLGPVAGNLSDKHGPRWYLFAGFLFCVPFFVCFRFVTENTINHKILLCGLLVAIGIGQALQVAPLMAEISWAAEEGREGESGDEATSEESGASSGGEAVAAVPYAQAYALYNIAFSAGAIVGPLLAGMVRESAGFGTVGWSLALINGFTALVVANWSGGPPLHRLWMEKNKARSAEAAGSNPAPSPPIEAGEKPVDNVRQAEPASR